MIDFFWQTQVPLSICKFQHENQRNLLGGVSFLQFQQLLNPCQIPEERIKQKREKTPSLDLSKHLLCNPVVPNYFTRYYHTPEYKYVTTICCQVGSWSLITPQEAFFRSYVLVCQGRVIGIPRHLAQSRHCCVYCCQVSAWWNGRLCHLWLQRLLL